MTFRKPKIRYALVEEDSKLHQYSDDSGNVDTSLNSQGNEKLWTKKGSKNSTSKPLLKRGDGKKIEK